MDTQGYSSLWYISHSVWTDTSRLSAFCMSLGIMILLVFAEYAVEQWVERRRERKEKEDEE